MKGYPRGFKTALLATFGVLGASGLLLVPTALEFRFGFDVAWRLPGGARLWVAAAHAATALLICAFAGALWSVHMRAGWRGRRHVVSGLLTIGSLTAAALSALGVYYLGSETWLVSASAAHTAFGVVGLLLVCLHASFALIARARRRVPYAAAAVESFSRIGAAEDAEPARASWLRSARPLD
jgi:hypothetical protein